MPVPVRTGKYIDGRVKNRPTVAPGGAGALEARRMSLSRRAMVAPVSPAMESPTHARYVVLAFTLAMTAVAYLDRVCIAMAAPSMKADLNLTDAEMGYVFSAFTLAYALFEVPSGWLAD